MQQRHPRSLLHTDDNSNTAHSQRLRSRNAADAHGGFEAIPMFRCVRLVVAYLIDSRRLRSPKGSQQAGGQYEGVDSPAYHVEPSKCKQNRGNPVLQEPYLPQQGPAVASIFPMETLALRPRKAGCPQAPGLRAILISCQRGKRVSPVATPFCSSSYSQTATTL